MKRKEPLTVPLNQKRLLSIEEFQVYCGLGRNSAMELARKAECRVNIEKRRLLIDRVKFDQWCAENNY
jgi:hypothetical protein